MVCLASATGSSLSRPSAAGAASASPAALPRRRGSSALGGRLPRLGSTTSPCSSSCLMRASMRPCRSRSGADTSASSCVSGATIAPTSCPRRTSSGRQRREPVDLLARERLALEDPSAQREDVRLLRGRGERLRDGSGIARRLDERDRGRAFEHDEQRVGARLLRRPARERVLDDPESRAVREQLVAQRLELLVRQPAIVRDDERLGGAELRGELLDDPFLVRFQHVISS